MKDLILKYKKAIFKGILTLLIFVAFSVVAMLILWGFGVINFDGGMHINVHILDSFTDSWTGVAIFILLQIICTTVLCFLPGTTMMFIVLGQAIYPDPTTAFIIVFLGVMISSTLMYLVGRFGGYKVCEWMLGKEDCEKATTLLRDNGSIFFPVMMLFPIFPDDALVMISGTLKMRLGWFFPSIIIGRGIGIATIIYGLSIVPFDKFTEPWHWIVFVLVCVIGVVGIFLGALKFNKFMSKRSKKDN